MALTTYLDDLQAMHPGLYWHDIVVAAASVLMSRGSKEPIKFKVAIEEVPGWPDEALELSINTGRISADDVKRVRRTHEPTRRVEMAAIAIAGLALYHAGGHTIRDVALRFSGADYIVDEEEYLLEVAGRSRKVDLGPAWKQKWQRVPTAPDGGFFVFVAEFESPAGRLRFQE